MILQHTPNDLAIHIVNVIVSQAIQQRELSKYYPTIAQTRAVLDKIFVALHYANCREFISASLGLYDVISLQAARDLISIHKSLARGSLTALTEQFYIK